MKYFKSECGKLIQYNVELSVFKLRNTVKRIDTRISQEEFDKLDTKQIKKTEFARLMNIYFKNIKHEWEFGGKKFRKLDNFESDNCNLSTNYVLGKDVPYHSIPEYSFISNLVLVYHWE